MIRVLNCNNPYLPNVVICELLKTFSMAILCVCITSVVFLSVHVSSDKIMEGIPIALSISTLTNNAYATPCTPDLPTPQLVTDSDLDKTYGVIIIGAGMAGLEAAHQLHLKGIDNVIILEKNDRIGGRVWSVDYNGTCIEKGASWIHGLNNDTKIRNPLYDITLDKKISTMLTDAESVIVKDSNGMSYPDFHDESWNYYENFTKFVDVTRDYDPSLSMSDMKNLTDRYYQEHENWSETERAMFDYSIFWNQEFDQAADLDTISTDSLEVNQYFEGDEAHEVIFNNGYDQIIKFISEEFKNKIRHATVTNVDYSKQLVSVTTTDQDTFNGKYVISTLPLGVMKNEIVKFYPSFEDTNDQKIQKKAQAINILKNGTMDKYYLIFNETQPFWATDKDYDWINRIPDNSSDRSWLTFLNLYKYTGKPILLAFNMGNSAIKLENENNATIKKEVMTVLGKMYDQNISEPTIIRTTYAKDPSFYGSYSFVSAGGTIENYESLAAPIDKKLFFAGEATLYEYMGTVHGAYLSGYVAAQEIQALEHKVDPPLTQSENGVPIPYVICKENYNHVIIPSENVRVACISEASKQDLAEIWDLKEKDFKTTFPWRE